MGLSPTVERLFATYPNIREAIAWVELMIVVKEDDVEQSSWELLTSAKPPMSPQEIVDAIRDSMEGEIVGKAEIARKQMDHPEFYQYICGKMGCY